MSEQDERRVVATLADRGGVTYEPPPVLDSNIRAYVDAAFAADATLQTARAAYVDGGVDWPDDSRDTVYSRYTDLWRKVEAAAIGEEETEQNKRVKAARRAADNAIVAEIEKKHPIAARRAQIVRALKASGYEMRAAVELAAEAIPDDADEGDTEAPLVTSGAELVEGVDGDAMTPMIAPGLAYVGRAVLVHAQRGRGKTTLLSWLAARATVDGRRILVVGDDDTHSWQVRMVQFGAQHDRWDYGRASRLAAAGQIEKAVEVGLYEWVIVDNWRTWGLASGVSKNGGFGNTDAAAVPIERLVHLTDGGVALTVVANEGHHNQNRSRDSIVVEDAVHAVRKVLLDEASRITTLQPALKTRVGIDTETWRWRLRDTDDGLDEIDTGAGCNRPVGGGKVPGNGNRMDGEIVLFLRGAGAVTFGEVDRAVTGRRETIAKRLHVLAVQDVNGLWKLAPGDADTIPVPKAPPPTPGTGGTLPVPVPVPARIPVDGNGRNDPPFQTRSAPVPVPVPARFKGNGRNDGNAAVPVPVPIVPERVPGTGDRPVCTTCRARPSARGMNTCPPCVRMLRVWPELRGKDYINAAVLQDIMGPEWTVKAAG